MPRHLAVFFVLAVLHICTTTAAVTFAHADACVSFDCCPVLQVSSSGPAEKFQGGRLGELKTTVLSCPKNVAKHWAIKTANHGTFDHVYLDSRIVSSRALLTETEPDSGTYTMLGPAARRVNDRPVYARVRGDSDPDGEASDDFLYYWEFGNGRNWIIR